MFFAQDHYFQPRFVTCFTFDPEFVRKNYFGEFVDSDEAKPLVTSVGFPSYHSTKTGSQATRRNKQNVTATDDAAPID